MTNFIIRDLDDSIAMQLKLQSKKRGLSINKYVCQLIEKGVLEVGSPQKPPNKSGDDVLWPRNSLAKLAGSWSKAEFTAFNRAAKSLDSIDAEIWK